MRGAASLHNTNTTNISHCESGTFTGIRRDGCSLCFPLPFHFLVAHWPDVIADLILPASSCTKTMSTDSDASEGGWSLCPPASSDASLQYVYYLSRYGPTQLIQLGLKDPVTDISAKPFENVKRIVFFIPGELCRCGDVFSV